jgi:hydrogenase-4 component F
VIIMIVTPALGAALTHLVRRPFPVAFAASAVAAAAALALAAIGATGGHGIGRLAIVDRAGAPFLGAIALVGFLSVLASPRYLKGGARASFFGRRGECVYYEVLLLFWSALLAVPVAASLAEAWLVVEATTAASALLVAFSGTRSALEAGWKYLVLTTAGLTVALLGIVMLIVAAPGTKTSIAIGTWQTLGQVAHTLPHDAASAAFVLILVGLAAKVGWAPVHNWLPDAHSEAPPPVSALLSAALLPAVMLVAWRTKSALAPTVGVHFASNIFIAFGLVSLAVAVPFLWRPQAWKRLLAYSSLEHMGVLALGIGFGGRIAIAGVVLHVIGHALAKALGFYTATPLLEIQPAAATRAARNLARTSGTVGSAYGLSLMALSGLPPSPLFVSELFILLGGISTGHLVPAAVAAVLLALGFLGLAHVLIEGLVGRARSRRGLGGHDRRLAALTVVTGLLLVGLLAVAIVLPGSSFVEALWRWSS